MLLRMLEWLVHPASCGIPLNRYLRVPLQPLQFVTTSYTALVTVEDRASCLALWRAWSLPWILGYYAHNQRKIGILLRIDFTILLKSIACINSQGHHHNLPSLHHLHHDSGIDFVVVGSFLPNSSPLHRNKPSIHLVGLKKEKPCSTTVSCPTCPTHLGLLSLSIPLSNYLRVSFRHPKYNRYSVHNRATSSLLLHHGLTDTCIPSYCRILSNKYLRVPFRPLDFVTNLLRFITNLLRTGNRARYSLV
jgi:hypothetical protein